MQDRDIEVKDALMKLLAYHGRIYTMGLMMGILVRLSRYDYNLYKEILDRADKCDR
jgi:hypothetical protein